MLTANDRTIRFEWYMMIKGAFGGKDEGSLKTLAKEFKSVSALFDATLSIPYVGRLRATSLLAGGIVGPRTGVELVLTHGVPILPFIGPLEEHPAPAAHSSGHGKRRP